MQVYLVLKTKVRTRLPTNERLTLEALLQPVRGHHVLHHRDGRQELDRARHLAGDEVRALLRGLGNLPAQDVQLLKATSTERGGEPAGHTAAWHTRPGRDLGGVPGHGNGTTVRKLSQTHDTRTEAKSGICSVASVSVPHRARLKHEFSTAPATRPCDRARGAGRPDWRRRDAPDRPV